MATFCRVGAIREPVSAGSARKPGQFVPGREQGAPAIEAYPLDNRGAKVDQTMAYAGLKANFDAAGFRHVADTSSVLSGHPRVLMRRDLD
ncbi:hypothetical protein [Nocardioides nitrophenolicus]|uniref:hypothetical protein n=1 Tax=Nocardioides nitrophenolicus TaxID=60489 RepID=UPI001EF7D29D|nr:hypothetical protein [Nocardioides nitrophenolicus]MBM7515896.1 hypothetical protein [Nocardioides nitrophenolicus]